MLHQRQLKSKCQPLKAISWSHHVVCLRYCARGVLTFVMGVVTLVLIRACISVSSCCDVWYQASISSHLSRSEFLFRRTDGVQARLLQVSDQTVAETALALGRSEYWGDNCQFRADGHARWAKVYLTWGIHGSSRWCSSPRCKSQLADRGRCCMG